MRCFPLVSPEERLPPELSLQSRRQWGDKPTKLSPAQTGKFSCEELAHFWDSPEPQCSCVASSCCSCWDGVHWCWFCLLWTVNYRLAVWHILLVLFHESAVSAWRFAGKQERSCSKLLGFVSLGKLAQCKCVLRAPLLSLGSSGAVLHCAAGAVNECCSDHCCFWLGI